MPGKTPLWVRVLVVCGIAAGAVGMMGLGLWQLARLEARRSHNAEIRRRLAQPPIRLSGESLTATLPLEYRRVVARGAYDFSQEIVLSNRSHDEVPGVHVVTPLRIAGSDMAVLVDRGWIPYEQAAPEARAAYQAPLGEVEVQGILRASQTRLSPLLPDDPLLPPGSPRLDAWYWLNIDRIQRQVPYPLLVLFIELAPGAETAGSQLPVPGYEIDLTDGPHLSYAIQWFSFAAVLVFGPLAYWYQGRRRRSG